MKDPRDIILAPVVSEKSYGLIEQGVYTFKVHPQRQQAGDPRRRRGHLGRQGRQGQHDEPQGQGHPRPAEQQVSAASPTPSGPSSPWQRATRSRCSRTEDTMAIRSRKPTSPGRRFQTTSDFKEITKTTPERTLLAPAPKTGGRNAYGRKTARHRGGGHKRQYRIIDFKRVKDGVTAKVAAIEYDPNRTCRIALLHYADGEKAYILAPKGLHRRHARAERPGLATSSRATPCRCASSPSAPSCTTSSCAPVGGGKMARSAGMAVQLVAKEGEFATLRLPSTEMRRVLDRLPRHRRRGRQQRARADHRSARPAATAGRASARRPVAWP